MPDWYLYRTFHRDSSGQNSRDGFTAGLPKGLYRRTYQNVKRSLKEYFDLSNHNPTPWISTTNDLLRAITIAINCHGQNMQGVSIAVIDPDIREPESAEDLSCKYRTRDIDPVFRRTEFLYEGHIDSDAVVACVSFQRLIDNGLYYLVPEFDPSHSVWTIDQDDDEDGDEDSDEDVDEDDDKDDDEDDDEDEDEDEDSEDDDGDIDDDGDTDDDDGDMDNNSNDVTEIPLAAMRISVQETPPPMTGRAYWTGVGNRAAKVACLFGEGAHTRLIAAEIVGWWVENANCPRQIQYIGEGINGVLQNPGEA